MSKFWITPLTMIWTLGVVTGVVGIVVVAAVEDQVVDAVQVDRRVDLQRGVARCRSRSGTASSWTDVSIAASMSWKDSVFTPP